MKLVRQISKIHLLLKTFTAIVFRQNELHFQLWIHALEETISCLRIYHPSMRHRFQQSVLDSVFVTVFLSSSQYSKTTRIDLQCLHNLVRLLISIHVLSVCACKIMEHFYLPYLHRRPTEQLKPHDCSELSPQFLTCGLPCCRTRTRTTV